MQRAHRLISMQRAHKLTRYVKYWALEIREKSICIFDGTGASSSMSFVCCAVCRVALWACRAALPSAAEFHRGEVGTELSVLSPARQRRWKRLRAAVQVAGKGLAVAERRAHGAGCGGGGGARRPDGL